MLTIGCHLSTSKGFEAMGRTALSIGADTFAFFTRNPRGGTVRELDPDDVAALRGILDEYAFGPLVAHAPYTYNLCSAKAETVEFARRAMREDLARMERIALHDHVAPAVPFGIDDDHLPARRERQVGMTEIAVRARDGGTEIHGHFIDGDLDQVERILLRTEIKSDEHRR